MATDVARTSAQVFADGGRTVVAVQGEIDMSTAPLLERVLRAACASSGGTLVVDVDDVSFMDSSGLRTIAQARQRMASRGRSLVVRNTPDNVRRLFTIAGAQGLLEAG